MIPALNAVNKLIAILSGTTSLSKIITESPGLMINQFSSSSFDATVQKMSEEGLLNITDAGKVNEFKRIIVMKDSVADFMWHFLVGFVAITTSYNIVMNNVCQKTEILTLPVTGETPSLSSFNSS